MSAPDPKKWQASDKETATAFCADMAMTFQPNIGKLTEAIARRRALEELRALAKRLDDQDEHDDSNATGMGEAWAIVHRRIAEIEAEAE